MVDRREQRRLETQRRLLDAAEQVLSQKGYEEASILDITEAADVSKRTFYLHFTDKESVIEALALQRFRKLRQQVEEKEPDPECQETFREGFHRITQIIFEFAERNAELMQIIYGPDGSYRIQTMAREFMAQAWEENMGRKCNYLPNPPVPTSILAHAIAGVIHQLLCWHVRHPAEYTPAQMADLCTSVLFDGVEVNFDLTIPMRVAHAK